MPIKVTTMIAMATYYGYHIINTYAFETTLREILLLSYDKIKDQLFD